MRTEAEMMRLILDFAHDEETVRAVVLNGSRANPTIEKDIFRDYDTACYVSDVRRFVDDRRFLDRFGDVLMMQVPEEMSDPAPENDGSYAYLMLFADGNRIDLNFHPVEKLGCVVEDTLSVSLVDKDGRLTNLPPASERGYIPNPPANKTFTDCCNEFFWVSSYVAKELWRGWIMLAKHIMESYVRPAFMKMLAWQFADRTRYRRAPGEYGTRFREVFDEETWNRITATYADADGEATWEALFTMLELFGTTARAVGAAHGIAYPHEWETNMTEYLRRVHRTPQGASELA